MKTSTVDNLNYERENTTTPKKDTAKCTTHKSNNSSLISNSLSTHKHSINFIDKISVDVNITKVNRNVKRSTNGVCIYKQELDSIHEYYTGSQIWIWGEDCLPTFNNGDIQYGFDSINNSHLIPEGNYNNMIDSDPMFVDAENLDFRLKYESPCVNTGMEEISGIFVSETDLAGAPRIFNDRIDMGCYEWNNIGLFENYQNNNAITVYPNPVNKNSVCRFNLSKDSDVVVRVYGTIRSSFYIMGKL